MGKRKKRTERELVKSLVTELAKDTALDDSKIVVEPAGETKMSEVLVEFIEPYLKYWKTERELEVLLSTAIIAWNATLVRGSERSSLIENTIKVTPPEIRADTSKIIEEMMQRKELKFAQNRRMIVNYKLTMSKKGPHVTVLSTLLSDSADE